MTILGIWAFIYGVTFLLTVSFLVLGFYGKHKLSRMNEEKWEVYFASLSVKRVFKQGYCIFLSALLLTCFMAYRLLGYFMPSAMTPNLMHISICFNVILLTVTYKLWTNKTVLLGELDQIIQKAVRKEVSP